MKPKVTILCTAYNHKNFIREALSSLVTQKTNFPFEIIVHDDASTDGTTEIIHEFEEKYPKIIKAIYQKENQFSKGKDIILDFMFDLIKGEYVALNEGDDYWTDENKLQRQVDFLDANLDFTICFHPVKVIWNDNSLPESFFPSDKLRFNRSVLTLNDLLKHNFIQTNSVLYRWKLTKELWPKKRVLPGDYLLHLIHAKYGKIGFLPKVMSVYRRNPGGIWYRAWESDDWFLRYGVPQLRFFQVLKNLFGVEKSQDIIFVGQRIVGMFLKNKDFDSINKFSEEFPEFWDEIISIDSSINYYKQEQRKLKRKYRLLLATACISFFIFIIFYYFVFL